MRYERVELIDTTDGSFMTPKEAKRLMLRGSTLLRGIQSSIDDISNAGLHPRLTWQRTMTLVHSGNR